MFELISKIQSTHEPEKKKKRKFLPDFSVQSKNKTEKYFSKYFSNNYHEAREKFRDAAKNKGLVLSSEEIKNEQTEHANELTVDIAYSNPSNDNSHSDKLLIIVSGVHGVEGYTGSAAQLIFLNNIYDKYKDKFVILLIHAYNPYGFNFNRRVNENNVDLNRNCLNHYNIKYSDDSLQKIVRSHKSVFSPEKPRRNGLIEESKYSLILAKSVMKHGIENTISAGYMGQNIYPKGVSYAGISEEASTRIFKKLINEYTSKFKKVFLMDIHTGIGRKNILSALTNVQNQSNDFLFLKKIVKNVKSRKFSSTIGLRHKGHIAEYFMENSKARKNIDLLIEFGTVSNISSTLSLAALSRINLEENQITHFGPKKKLDAARMKLKKAYYPNTNVYKKTIIKKSEEVFENLCREFERV
jgi:hypothetical protein